MEKMRELLARVLKRKKMKGFVSQNETLENGEDEKAFTSMKPWKMGRLRDC
jgi:hypothetical protein